MHYIVEPEYVSCLILVLLAGYTIFDKNRPSHKQDAFRAALFISLGAIVINLASVAAIENAQSLPIWYNRLINTLYFIATPLMSAAVTISAVVAMFEERYEAARLRRMVVVILLLFAVSIPIAIVNLFTGWLFSFTPSMQYVRGPLNKSIALYFAADILLTLYCYYAERKRVKRSFRFVVSMLPLLCAALGLLQLNFPNTILTGTVAMSALLLLFIYSQQQRGSTDSLTELSNREAFYHTLERYAARGVLFHVMMIGIRDYKLINTRLGQRSGDELLHSVGEYLLTLDRRATAYRFAGVEFAVIVVDMRDEEYEQLYRSIRARFEQPWSSEEETVLLNAAFTDIAYPAHAGSVNELVASLEYAVRLAKSDISNRPVRFDKRLRNEFGRRNYVSAQLELALREDRYFLYFQPVYDCAKKRFTGGEVLLRLNEPNGRPISPDEFIPLAMEAGIASELGWMVIEKVCRFLSENPIDEIEWLSINVSAQQHEFAETVKRVSEQLAKYGVPASKLKLEITERVLIEDRDKARQTMDDLRELGVGIFLDDFGTGYSNLVNVLSLPFECVKIDKGFLSDVAQTRYAYGMLETVVRGLRALHVSVLAEGVETKEQDRIVHDLGIDSIQGYYYARPMPGEEFAWLLRSGQAGGVNPHE